MLSHRFSTDVDYTFSAQALAAAQKGHTGVSAARSGGEWGGEKGAAGCVWLADETLMGPLYRRVASFLPKELGGGMGGSVCVCD